MGPGRVTPPEPLKNSHRASRIVAEWPLSPITGKSEVVPKAARTRIGLEQSKICNTGCESLPYLRGL
jgi:hypothetical protein